MLASKIEDFLKLWPSKRPSKIHHFLHRSFIDFGSVLASNMGPSWEPRRLKFRKNGFQKMLCCHSVMDLKTIFLQNIVLDRFGIDFGRSGLHFRRFLDEFRKLLGLLWACFRLLLLGGLRPPDNPALDLVFVVLG